MSSWSQGIAALRSLPTLEFAALIGIPVYGLLFLAYFAIRCLFKGMPKSERFEKTGSSFILPRFLLEYGYWMLGQQVRALIALGFTANGVTVLSLISATAGAVALGMGRFGLGGWLMFFSFFCDAMDGMVARKLGTSSNRGEFFDSIIDRYADMVIGFGFLYYYRNDPIPAAIIALAMIGGQVMGYARAKGEAVGIDPNVGYMQRHERAAYIGFGTCYAPILAAFIETGSPHPMFHLSLFAWLMVAIFTNITAVWRAAYVLKRMPKAPTGQPEAAAVPPPVVREDLAT
jgi:phosphatidylglycerophosphate synthase